MDEIIKIENRDSISSLEKLVGKNGVKISVNPYAKAFLEQSIQNMGNHYFQILNVYLEPPATFISNILSNVRAKLLDFMLELENQFGEETEIKDLIEKQAIVNNIMNTTINNSGEGAVINSGNENSIKAKVTIVKGDKESLRKELIKAKVHQEDVNQLLAVIDDEPPISKDNFGEGVNNWIQKMIGKALNGSWQVSIGAAGNILAETLQRYYGFQ